MPLKAQETTLPYPEPPRIPYLNSITPEILDHLKPVEQAPGVAARYLVKIPIRNVRASVLAYWLDSTHYPTPIDFQVARAIGAESSLLHDLPRLPGNGNGPRDFKLPEGISSVTPVDPQNLLVVTGTKEGLLALAPLLKQADVPLVQYEVEARFISLSRADLPKVGLKFEGVAGTSEYSFGSVAAAPANINIRLADFIKSGRVKVLTAPRVTVIDGLTAQLQSNTSTPFVTNQEVANQYGRDTASKNEAVKSGDNTPAPPGVAYVTNRIGMKTTVFQREHDLVSLSVTPVLGTRTISVDATVQDGQSFAIQLAPPKDKNQIVVVVTPRRIRRVGDDDSRN